MYWVYVLRSEKRKELYIGYTSNLQNRIAEHQRGESTSTKRYLPWELVYVEGYSSRNDALTREKNLKYFAKAYIQLKRRLKNSLADR
ncbi:MAG: GIY-YIG nuclease family protein [Patescibacteria group bacterium]